MKNALDGLFTNFWAAKAQMARTDQRAHRAEKELDLILGDLPLVEKNHSESNGKDHLSEAGSTFRWTGFVNNGLHVGTTVLR